MKIWKLALEIANDISDLLISFPKNEQYSLTSQMSRSSVSIPSNTAEGSARTDRSFVVFLDYAIGSSFELGTQLLLAQHRQYVTKDQVTNIEKKLIQWQKMTMSFQNNLNAEIISGKTNNQYNEPEN